MSTVLSQGDVAATSLERQFHEMVQGGLGPKEVAQNLQRALGYELNRIEKQYNGKVAALRHRIEPRLRGRRDALRRRNLPPEFVNRDLAREFRRDFAYEIAMLGNEKKQKITRAHAAVESIMQEAAHYFARTKP